MGPSAMDEMDIDAPDELLGEGVDPTNNLTKEERELFLSWHRTEASSKENLEGIALLGCSMRCIGSSYKSIKKIRSDIIEVLEDGIARDKLLQFATGVLKCCKYSSRVKILAARLSTEDSMEESSVDRKTENTVLLSPFMGHVKSEELGRNGRGERFAFNLTSSETLILNDVVDLLWELEVKIVELHEQPPLQGCNQISMKIYNILLIMKEMLTQLGILSEVFDAGTRFIEGDLLDNPSTQLLRLVEASVCQLKTRIGWEESHLISLIDSVYGLFGQDLVERRLDICGCAVSLRISGVPETCLVECIKPPFATWLVSKRQKSCKLGSLKEEFHPGAWKVTTGIPRPSIRKRKTDLDRKRVKQRRLDNGVDSHVKDLIEEEKKLLTAACDTCLFLYMITKNKRKWVNHFNIMDVIREAYQSKSGKSEEVEVLKDDVAMQTLLHFSYCMRRIKELSSSLRAISFDMLVKLKRFRADDAGN